MLPTSPWYHDHVYPDTHPARYSLFETRLTENLFYLDYMIDQYVLLEYNGEKHKLFNYTQNKSKQILKKDREDTTDIDTLGKCSTPNRDINDSLFHADTKTLQRQKTVSRKTVAEEKEKQLEESTDRQENKRNTSSRKGNKMTEAQPKKRGRKTKNV